MNQKQECPVCERHCPVENLRCPRGKKHFGIKEEPVDVSTLPVEEAIVVMLQQCGRCLHHEIGRREEPIPPAVLLQPLSEAEKDTVLAALRRCFDYWQTL